MYGPYWASGENSNILSQYSPILLGVNVASNVGECWMMLYDVTFDFSQILTQQRRGILSHDIFSAVAIV